MQLARRQGATLADVKAEMVAALPRLRRFARALAGHPADADDLVQLAMERALTRYAQWRPESKFESWMFGIMRNAWIDEIRSRQRRGWQSADDEDEALSLPALDGSREQVEAGLSVQQAMALLPDEQRQAVALVLVEGLSYKEAAAVMDVPMGTLTSRLARARDALQRALSGAGSGSDEY